MFNILVVEDDQDLREVFCSALSENGFQPIQASDGETALKVLDEKFIDLIITDVMMPKMNGYMLVKELRDSGFQLPILMITAKSSLSDKQEGFHVGTDDYMVKPIDVKEMIWRVSTLLRRSKINSERAVTIGGTKLDCDTLSVTDNNFEIVLPQKEFFLLFKLISSADKIFTRQQLIDEIWGMDFEGDGHTLDVHIGRLREKFRSNQDFEIITFRGLGYKAVKK